MNFVIEGIDPKPFAGLFDADDADLAAAGAIRRRADAAPGYPCRVTLEDAALGDTLLLVHYESHPAPTPYRSAYAIYVNEKATTPARYVDEIPPVMRRRPIALRIFDQDSMLIGADLVLGGTDGADVRDAILRAFDRPTAAYIHAHNAAHGCFAAAIRRAS